MLSAAASSLSWPTPTAADTHDERPYETAAQEVHIVARMLVLLASSHLRPGDAFSLRGYGWEVAARMSPPPEGPATFRMLRPSSVRWTAGGQRRGAGS